MRYWRRLLSFILIIILVNCFFAVTFSKGILPESTTNSYFKSKLKNSGGGFLAIVVNKNGKNASEIETLLKKNGTQINFDKKEKLSTDKDLLYAYSNDKRLILIFKNDDSKNYWTIKSVHTKRSGIVLNEEFLGLASSGFEGIDKFVLSSKKADDLIDLFFIFDLEKTNQLAIIVVLFGIIIILSILGFIISISKRFDKVSEMFLKFIPNLIILSYIYIIISPIYVLILRNVFLQILCLLLCSAIFSFFDLKKSMILGSSIGVLIILCQTFLFDNKLQLLSIVGYHPSYANRFYGIGNEFYTYLMGFFLILSIVYDINIRRLIMILSFLSVMFIIPYYTVNFGGFASLAAGILTFLMIKSRDKLKILGFASAFFVLTVLLVKFNQYISNVFSSFRYLLWMITRKLMMNFSYFIDYPYTILTFISFIILFYICMTDKWNVISSIEGYKDRIGLFFSIAVFAFLLNDSGVIIITLFLGFMITAIYYTKMVKEYGVY